MLIWIPTNLSYETEDVSDLVSGYLVRHILNKSEYQEYKHILISKENCGLPKNVYGTCLAEA